MSKKEFETIESFKARGGKVEVIPAVKIKVPNKVGEMVKKAPKFMTLEEANLYLGEKEDSEEEELGLIFKHLPKEIREKYLDKAIKLAVERDEQI